MRNVTRGLVTGEAMQWAESAKPNGILPKRKRVKGRSYGKTLARAARKPGPCVQFIYKE